jgi:hypothetical protein
MKAAPWLLLGLALVASACGDEGFADDVFDRPEWDVSATVDEANGELVLQLTVRTVHDNDFVHMSIRKEGWDNDYRDRVEEDVDWSRTNTWFRDQHPDTYLEGGIYPAPGDYRRLPKAFSTYEFRPTLEPGPRANWPDVLGTDYSWVNQGYNYADGQGSHPGFAPGEYEVEIYAWYTGAPNDLHPIDGDEGKVQFVHYERRLAITRFTIEE